MPWLFLVLCTFAALSFPTAAATHFTTNATWKYYRGTNEASLPDRTLWRSRSFNDSGWSEGVAPFYFDAGTGASPYIGNTLLSDMRGNYNHLFLRKSFTVDDPLLIYALKLRFKVDDGFVLWVNGQELLRQGVTQINTLTNNSVTSIAPEPLPLKIVDLTNPRPAAYLVAGQNSLAVQVINATKTDDDLFFDLGLDSPGAVSRTRLCRQ